MWVGAVFETVRYYVTHNYVVCEFRSLHDSYI